MHHSDFPTDHAKSQATARVLVLGEINPVGPMRTFLRGDEALSKNNRVLE